MKKKYKYLFSFFILLTLFFWTLSKVGTKDSYIAQSLKSLLSKESKVFLKKTIFAIPVNTQATETNSIKIKKLEILVALLNSRIEYLEDKDYVTIPFIGDQLLKTISSNTESKTYQLTNYQLPFPNYSKWMAKPVAYLEQNENSIIIANGIGQFFSLSKNEISKQRKAKIQLSRIESNIKNIIDIHKYPDFYDTGMHSIKDILVSDGKIYVSHNHRVRGVGGESTRNEGGYDLEGCYNTRIIYADLNELKYFNFENFFTIEECGIGKDVNPQHGGGRMKIFKNGKLLLTMGDYGFSDKAQDENSIFGKIVSIDMKSKKHEIISLGHRNPQGLFYDKNSDVVLNTEHGPIGGDEININILKNNQKTTNFGWPKVAYGLMDDGSKPENSHEKFGFTPPIKYYDPAIGISEIIKLPNFDNLNHPNDFLVASMGWNNQLIEGDRSLQHIRFDQNFSKIISIEQIPIDQRVRDMIIEKEKRIVIMILENNPSLGILQF